METDVVPKGRRFVDIQGGWRHAWLKVVGWDGLQVHRRVNRSPVFRVSLCPPFSTCNNVVLRRENRLNGQQSNNT